jgi:hypothetical protein
MPGAVTLARIESGGAGLPEDTVGSDTWSGRALMLPPARAVQWLVWFIPSM